MKPHWIEETPQATQDYVAGRRLDEVECIVADIAGRSTVSGHEP